MIQALPLVESGAADAAGLGTEQLALACASHSGARTHVDRVSAWLKGLGLGDDDLRCGAHMPSDPAENRRLTCSDQAPCQVHNNCSGKHAGFLTWTRHHRGEALRRQSRGRRGAPPAPAGRRPRRRRRSAGR